MKKGNASVLAFGIIFLVFLAFMLFKSHLVQPEITGYATEDSNIAETVQAANTFFNADEVISTNISIPITGNISFTLTPNDVVFAKGKSVTNSSFIRITLLNKNDGHVPDNNLNRYDKWLSLETLAQKLNPPMALKEHSAEGENYKTPELTQASTYKLDMKEANIIPEKEGTYLLTFALWYTSEAGGRNDDSVLSKEILVNFSELGVTDGVAVTKINITAVQINDDNNIIKVKPDFVVGDALICNVSFTSKTAVTPHFGFYIKSKKDAPFVSVDDSAIICIPGNCGVMKRIEESALEPWYCAVELVDAGGHSFKNSSGTIKMANKAPELIKNIPGITLSSENYTLHLKNYFQDPDGDVLEYDISAATLQSVIAFENDDMNIRPLSGAKGEDSLTLYATDGIEDTESNEFKLIYNMSGSDGISGGGCVPDWSCTSAGACVNEEMPVRCTDKNNCGITEGKPETQKCTVLNEGGTAGSADQGTSTNEPNIPSAVKLDSSQAGTSDNSTTYVILAIVFVVVIVLGGGAVYYFKFMKKGDEEEEEQAVVGGITGESAQYGSATEVRAETNQTAQENKPASVDDIYKYINDAVAAGKTVDTAKSELLTAGWDSNDVKRAGDVITLKKYAADKIKAGFDKQKIRETLAAKGWKQDVLDDVFKE